MGYLRGLAWTFAVLAMVVYGLAAYQDPDGFRDFFAGGADPVAGDPATLEDFVETAARTPVSAGEGIAHVVTLLPPSEADYRPDFLTFRDALREAVRARDLEAVLALSSEDILLSLDGEMGRGAFGEILEAPDMGESHWQQLEDALALPSFSVDVGEFCAPYVTCAPLPEESVDLLEPYETVFAVAQSVIIRSAPSSEAEALGEVSYQSLQLAAALEDPQWAEVFLSDGTTGFVDRKDVRAMLGPQVQFSRQDGVWRLQGYLPGA